MRFTIQSIVFGLAVICLPAIGFAQKKKAKNPNSLFDLEYANVDGISLKLDLLLPSKKTDKKPELVVFFHGGPQYRDKERSKLILDMLQKTLRSTK
jgi:cephalosporin-C deacetylase-like acetyl esterase